MAAFSVVRLPGLLQERPRAKTDINQLQAFVILIPVFQHAVLVRQNMLASLRFRLTPKSLILGPGCGSSSTGILTGLRGS